jgi:hypothetical protein
VTTSSAAAKRSRAAAARKRQAARKRRRAAREAAAARRAARVTPAVSKPKVAVLAAPAASVDGGSRQLLLLGLAMLTMTVAVFVHAGRRRRHGSV